MEGRRFLVPLLFVAGIGWTHADIDVAEYETKGAVTSELTRLRLQDEFARQREAEARRARDLEAAMRQREAQRQAALAARPYPLRLEEMRCTGCHAAGTYRGDTHTALGWLLVVLRMRHLHDAPLTTGEIPVLVAQLGSRRPASAARTALEYGAALGVVGLPWLVYRAWRRQASRTTA